MSTLAGTVGIEARTGVLIVNADDWGRDRETTDRILTCVQKGAVSSGSAMVFMEDSERAANVARECDVDTGLHLNFTTPFSMPGTPATLREHQQRLTKYLRWNRLAQVVYHPGLARSFEYAVKTQIDEYARLYGRAPQRLDGHHHMHLCSNVLLGGLLPAGTTVRRNFSFESGEKGSVNRLYRQAVDSALAKRHGLTDYFFSLPPLVPASRVQKIFALANQFTVEVETHPVNPDEHQFLAGGEIFRLAGDLRVATSFSVGRK